MRPGPPPKSNVLRLLSANAGHRQLNRREPKPNSAQNLRAPIRLSKNGLKFWKRYAGPLHDLGLLTEIDGDMLALGAQWFDIHLRAVSALKKSLTQESEANGNVARPEIAIARQAFSCVRTVLAEFGCSPAQRTRVTAIPPPTKEDPAEKYFRDKPRGLK